MRHGLDDESFIGGWSSHGLTRAGAQQVKLATPFIANNIKVATVYHSNLTRTIETATIINATLKVPVSPLNTLRELNKGLLNGLPERQAKKLYPGFFPSPDIHTRYPNGESLCDLYDRTRQFLGDIDKYDKTLLITHRGFINMVYFILNNLEPTLEKRQFNVTHGSIHKIDNGKISRIY